MLPMAAQHKYKLQAARSVFDCESPDVTRSLRSYSEMRSGCMPGSLLLWLQLCAASFLARRKSVLNVRLSTDEV
jgi:hypothetical protein